MERYEKFFVSTILERKHVKETGKTYKLDSPQSVALMTADHLNLKDCDKEHFVVACLSHKLTLNAICTISVGCLTCTIVHPREVFKPAILSSSSSIILIHNHPSGDPTPSKEDKDITDRLVKAGEILGIEVVDHIIVGDQGYISFREESLI